MSRVTKVRNLAGNSRKTYGFKGNVGECRNPARYRQTISQGCSTGGYDPCGYQLLGSHH